MSNPRVAYRHVTSRGTAGGTDGAALNQRHVIDRLVLDQVRVAGWDRLLFVECGDGWLVEEAWRRMGKGCAWGLSTFPQLVELAVQLRGIPDRIEFKAWSGGQFPLPDRSFDRVISCVPLIRYLEPLVVLQEIARVLRPGGDAYLLDFEPPPAKTPPSVSADDLRSMLVSTGLKEVGRSGGETAPRGREDHLAPVVIHARWCAGGT